MGIGGGAKHDYHLQKGDDPAKWWERKDVINVNLYLASLVAEERDAWVRNLIIILLRKRNAPQLKEKSLLICW